MKRLILALAGYAIYRWWTKTDPQPARIAGILPPPRNRPATTRKSKPEPR